MTLVIGYYCNNNYYLEDIDCFGYDDFSLSRESRILNEGEKYGNGIEQEWIEFKQFVIPKSLSEKICIDNFIDRNFTKELNTIVNEQIENYIEKYLPKYLASMSRTFNNEKDAELIFGVDDDGVIIGITTLNGINIDDIYSSIKSLSKNIRGVSKGIECEEVKLKFINSIKIEIIDLNVKEKPDNILKIVKSIRKKENKYNKIFEKYNYLLNKWREELYYYKSKLEFICNEKNHRSKLLEYCIEENAPESIIDILKSDEMISFEIGVVREKKYDKTTIEYYVTQYKEFHNNRLNKIKPKNPKIIKYDYYLKNKFSQFQIMNGKWKNPVKYQIIVFKLKTNENPLEWIEYKKGKNWISLCRTTSARGDPCCMVI